MTTSVEKSNGLGAKPPNLQKGMRLPIAKSPCAYRRGANLGLKMKTECTTLDGVREVIDGKQPIVLSGTKYYQNTARLSGTIVVRKSQMHNDTSLRIYVQYSTDDWLSHSEVDAQFMCEREFCENGECDYECDQPGAGRNQQPNRVSVLFYGFSLRLGRLSPGKRVEFVLCCDEDGVPVYRDDQANGIKNAAEVVLLPKVTTPSFLF